MHVERNARGERIIAKCSGEESHFDLDGALSSASQLEAYRVSSNAIVDSALRGYHGTILAYGQTGSGKTHTVFGGEGDDEGIAPRAFRQIFDAAAADEDKAEYSVSVSLVQIYCEVVTDLLAQSHEGRNEHLNIREADGRVFLENVAVKRVAAPQRRWRLSAKVAQIGFEEPQILMRCRADRMCVPLCASSEGGDISDKVRRESL